MDIGCKAILLADKRAHINEIHKEFGLMPLSERREVHLSLLCHKMSILKTNKKYFVTARVVGRRRTRGIAHNNMQIPNVSTEKGRCAFAYRGLKRWNALNPVLEIIVKFNALKNEQLKSTSAEWDNLPT